MKSKTGSSYFKSTETMDDFDYYNIVWLHIFTFTTVYIVWNNAKLCRDSEENISSILENIA